MAQQKLTIFQKLTKTFGFAGQLRKPPQFEFDKKEFNRALGMTLNHGKRVKAIYPLLRFGYDKKKCIEIVQDVDIEIPEMYKLGFQNNNCFNTGCVQGGIGYWQKTDRRGGMRWNGFNCGWYYHN